MRFILLTTSARRPAPAGAPWLSEDLRSAREGAGYLPSYRRVVSPLPQPKYLIPEVTYESAR